MKKRYIAALTLIISVILYSCTTVKVPMQTVPGLTGVHYLGEYNVSYNMNFRNTVVGGLSGIDYDALHNEYYFISDDRSDNNPARFYTAKIFFTPNGIDSVNFTGVQNMLQSNGSVYPNKTQDRLHTPDPEDMRYNAANGMLVWSSEGERIVRAKDTVLEDPSINVIATNGKYVGSFPLTANMHMHVTEQGPRQNGVFEGLSFADDYQTLFVSVEEPLYEDGPRAELTDNNAYIRILKYNVKTMKNTAQYAYKLDPVAHAPDPANGFKINGVPDILSIGNNKLLVIERSFSTGRQACTIKVYITDYSQATDIRKQTLKGNQHFIPVTKKLLMNMDDLGIYIDNIEGVCFGPNLPNGHKTLLFISDNNFSESQKTQLMLFELIE